VDLNGKVAIVTGAGSGIGYAIAERFATAGASVCVNYLGYEDEAKALVQRLPKAIAFKADVSKVSDVQAMVDATVKELGSIDVLVNNAGLERSMPFLDIDEATWDLMIDVRSQGWAAHGDEERGARARPLRNPGQ
jgi:NAD(P)-dependent dehydrogenase (short-subunit alcohol dehydrogenase family)